MSMKVIAYDVGTTGLKTCMFRVSAGESVEYLAGEVEHYQLHVLPNGGVEQDPADWWDAMARSTRRLLERSGAAQEEIRGVTFCSQFQTVVMVDRDGKPLRRAMSCMDARADRQFKRCMSTGLKIEGLDIVKVLKYLRITGAVSASAKDPAWKYLWVRDNEPDQKTYKWLDAKEYLTCRATGKMAASRDDASATFLYDVKKRCWSKTLCDMLGIDMDHLPPLCEATDQVGGLLPQAAEELGLAPGTPVFSGASDVILCSVGAGCVELGDVLMYSGTSGWVATTVGKLHLDLNNLIGAIVGVDPTTYTYVAELETCGKCMEWVKDRIDQLEMDYDQMIDYIRDTPAGVQHNLAFNYPFPLVVTKAEGAYLYDIDGNRYVDYLQAGGPTLLGSNYGPVNEKVWEVVRESGPVTGLFHPYEMKLAEKIRECMPWVEMYRCLASGTEADMVALRIARTYTGKQRIVKVGGAYHGWSDQLVYSLHIPYTKTFEAHGIPKEASANTCEFFPGDVEGLRRVLEENEKYGGTAAVLIEPFGPESGTRPVALDFAAKVRELCDEFGALLIFDEVVTAFRVGPGGAQGFFDVRPDLTVFGKIVAGGYPMAGGVGGRAEIMSCAAAGVKAGKKKAYVGGTLTANPLSCAAGYFAIDEIVRQDAAVKAGENGDKLCRGIQQLIDQYDLPFVTWNTGSIVHFEVSGVMCGPRIRRSSPRSPSGRSISRSSARP